MKQFLAEGRVVNSCLLVEVEAGNLVEPRILLTRIKSRIIICITNLLLVANWLEPDWLRERRPDTQ